MDCDPYDCPLLPLPLVEKDREDLTKQKMGRLLEVGYLDQVFLGPPSSRKLIRLQFIFALKTGLTGKNMRIFYRKY